MTSPIEDVEDFKAQLIKHSPLCRAINAKDVETVDRLIQQPDLDLKKEGDVALYYAICGNAPDIAYKLIQKGVDPNVCLNIHNWSLLHEATSSNYFECVCLLLSCGVDLQRNSEETPLMIAYKKKDKNIMKTLLYHYYEFDGTNLTNIKFNFKYVHHNNEDILLLFIALRSGYVKPFKIIWSRMDIAKFPPSQYFLSRYLFKSKFTRTEWLDCLYLILESPQFLNLLNIHLNFLTDVFTALSFKEFEDDRKLDVLYMCLSVGINLTFSDIIILGKEKEFINAVIYSGNNDWDPPQDDLYLSLNIIFRTCRIDWTTENVFYYFQKELLYMYHPINLIPWFTYFSLPRSMKTKLTNSFIWHCDTQIDLLYQVPEFPSLLELARLQVQRNIRETRTIKKIYQFHDAVKHLCLPKLIEDIILFKRPIYK